MNDIDYRNSIRDKYPVGTYVFAHIYTLQQQNDFEPKRAKVVRHTTEEQCKEGYRFGIIVEYKGKKTIGYPRQMWR